MTDGRFFNAGSAGGHFRYIGQSPSRRSHIINAAISQKRAAHPICRPSPAGHGMVRLILLCVGMVLLCGCGADLLPARDGTAETSGAVIPGANDDALAAAAGLPISRVRITSLDGVFVLNDAATPKDDLADRKPAFVAWWNDFAAQKRFVFGRLIETQVDVGHALLSLERDLSINLDSLIDDNPELNQAIVDAAAQSEDGIDWQPATYGTAVQIMGFPAPQATGDPDMDRLLFVNGGVDEFYGNLCRHAFKTTTELLPSPGPIPGPYMPITLAIRLSGCGDREPAIDETRVLSEDDTPPGLADAPAKDIVLFRHACTLHFQYGCGWFAHSTLAEVECEGPCCNDPCCDDPCCGTGRCHGCSGPCCGSTDPCCGSTDPCCGSTDPCCNCRPTHPCCGGEICCEVSKCCEGDCCAGNETCCDGVCQISTCSFTVNPVSGCPGATVDLTLQDGVCEPDCETMDFPAVSGISYITVNPPGSITCGGPPADRTFSVAISANAPAGEITFTLTGETSATACSHTVQVRVEPVLETISLSPAGTLVLGNDLSVNYEVSTVTGTGFDSVEMEIKNSLGQVVFASQGLSAGSGAQSAVWPGGMWNQSPHSGAFANPLNGPYQITLTGRKVDCPDQIQSSSIATKLVLEAGVRDNIPPGAIAARSSGLEDMLDALKIVMKLGAGETVFSGAGAISVTGANPDTKNIKVDAAVLNTLADGAYEVLFRDLRDEIGNFADEDGVSSNGIQPIKFNLELR